MLTQSKCIRPVEKGMPAERVGVNFENSLNSARFMTKWNNRSWYELLVLLHVVNWTERLIRIVDLDELCHRIVSDSDVTQTLQQNVETSVQALRNSLFQLPREAQSADNQKLVASLDSMSTWKASCKRERVNNTGETTQLQCEQQFQILLDV